MADRFPSLEELDSGTSAETQGVPLAFVPTSPDDFLSREKAVLGDDADQFTTGNDNAAFLVDGSDDLIGTGTGAYEESEEVSRIESSFPAIFTENENTNPSVAITSGQLLNEAPSCYDDEPEVIRKWREVRDLALEERAERSEEQKQQAIKNAQKTIDEFYENYNTKKEKNIAQTRREADEFLASREDTSAGGTSWERIAKLVDLSGKGVKGGASGTDKARFRDLLISLKKDANAPGASGY
ncbi:hypothetical protein K3495_g4287 [Podosphaera aphanis]|nr:hypothetical protein K3495_g4287 [Podosphaera aphanis]